MRGDPPVDVPSCGYGVCLRFMYLSKSSVRALSCVVLGIALCIAVNVKVFETMISGPVILIFHEQQDLYYILTALSSHSKHNLRGCGCRLSTLLSRYKATVARLSTSGQVDFQDQGRGPVY